MTLVRRSYHIRAYPNGAQQRMLDRWFGATRWLWNTTLAIRSEAYRVCGLSLSGNDLSRWLTQWKRTAGHEWLAEMPVTILTQCLRDQDRYLRQQQRCLARRQKGSRRREKQRLRIARAHARVSQARQCALHTLTTRLVREFDLICIEDLNVKGLVRGRGAREIQDAAFGEIRRQLTYKSDGYGRILVEVDRWYASSKRCSECQYTLDVLRLDQRQWTCPRCGTHHDRDINAARNLLAEGLRQLAGRDDRDLRVDARGACPDEIILAQVLAEEARSGRRNRVCLE